MHCYICKQVATDIPYDKGGRSVDCRACGAYSISGTALHFFHRDIWVFDDARACEWLGLRRSEGQERPLIEADTNLLRN